MASREVQLGVGSRVGMSPNGNTSPRVGSRVGGGGESDPKSLIHKDSSSRESSRESVGRAPLTTSLLSGAPLRAPRSGEGGAETRGRPVAQAQLAVLELPYPNRSGNRHVRHGQGGHYLSQEAQDYILAVKRVAERCRLAGKRFAGPLEMRWVLAPPDARERDQTNVLKVVEDALAKAGVILNDSNRVIRRTEVEWTDPIRDGAILVEILEYVCK